MSFNTSQDFRIKDIASLNSGGIIANVDIMITCLTVGADNDNTVWIGEWVGEWIGEWVGYMIVVMRIIMIINSTIICLSYVKLEALTSYELHVDHYGFGSDGYSALTVVVED